MTEDVVLTWRSTIRLLRARHVPERDLVGTCRIGLLLAALRVGVGDEIEAIRQQCAAAKGTAGAPAPDWTRWIRTAGAELALFLVAWDMAGSDGGDDDKFERLWRALDHAEVEERLLVETGREP